MKSVTVWIFIVVLIAWTISESSAQDKKKEEEKKRKEEEMNRKELEKKKKEEEMKMKEADKKKKEEEKKRKEEEKKKMEEEDKPKFIYRFVGFISEDDVKRSMLWGNPNPNSNHGGGNPYGAGYPMDYYG